MDVNPVFFNTVLWENQYSSTPGNFNQVYLDHNSGDPQFSHCVILDFVTSQNNGFQGPGSGANWNDCGWTQANPISGGDPLFNDMDNDDFTLTSGSSCIDSGSATLYQPNCVGGFSSYTAFPWSQAFQGNSNRSCLDTIDIGAYEYCTKSVIAKPETGTCSQDSPFLKIYPNPVLSQEQILLDFDPAVIELISIEIPDITGRKVFATEIKGTASPPLKISPGCLQPGLYLLLIHFYDDSGNQVQVTRKLVVK